MSSVEEIEVKVDEKGAAESTPAAVAEDASAAEKSNGDVSAAEKKSSPERENGDDEVVVAKVEKSMESKPERARKTILSEMCDHSKPQKGPPSFQEWQKQKEAEKFKNEPLELMCEKCDKEITTEIHYESGVCTKHKCPKCHAVLHTRAGTWDC